MKLLIHQAVQTSRRAISGLCLGLALAAAAIAAAPVPAASAQDARAPEAPAGGRVPGLWDPRRRPDQPPPRIGQQIRVLTEDDHPPFNFTGASGTLEGFNVDVARAVCAELQAACTVQARRWDTIVAALEAGQGDVIAAALAATPEARARLAFTDPYFLTPARFVVRLAGASDDTAPARLAGRRIAVAAGTAHEAYLRAFFPGSAIAAETGEAQAREALREGRADLLFGDGLSLALWLNGTGSGGCCRFAGGPYLESRFFGEGIAMAVRPSDAALRGALDFALFRLWEKGTYADLVRRWFPIDPLAGP